MIADRLAQGLDNPILMKHVRSRLRPQALWPSLAVVVILCLCITYAGYRLDMFVTGAAAGWLLALEAVLLVILGSSQVSASVNSARVSGILDFHRVSPLSPTATTLGFLFGAPVREYLLFAATLPFMVLCMVMGVPSFRAFVQLTILLLAGAWTCQAISLLSALLSKSKTYTGNVVGMIVLILMLSNGLIFGGMFSVNYAENDHRFSFYGLSLPWLPVVLLYQVPLLFFTYLAASRKMESARLHLLSKPQAIAAIVIVAILLLGGVWGQYYHDVLLIVALYVFVAAGVILTTMVTPTQFEYYKGLWRARKLGKLVLPWWDDLSLNWIFLAILAAIVLAAGTLTWSTPGDPVWAPMNPLSSGGSLSLALATGVLTVAYFGLALQFFLLRFAGRGRMYFGLFLFLVWGVPLLAGAIQSVSWSPRVRPAEPSYALFSLSPAAGIALAADTQIGDSAQRTAIQAAAITPALLFTFVFQSLLISARRRILKAVYVAAAERIPGDDGSNSNNPGLIQPSEALAPAAS
jgi:hypothetical protein